VSKRSARGAGSQDGLIALGLVLLAWVHRIFFLLSNRDRSFPFSVFYEGDSETFFHFARAIAEGRPYDGGIPFHPPFFPIVLAGMHALVGVNGAETPHRAIRITTALLGSVPIGLTYLVVKHYLGRAVALGAALLCLYSFGLMVVAVSPVSEGLYLGLLLTALLLFGRLRPATGGAPTSPPLLASFALGAVLGLATETRAEGSLLAIVLCVFLLARRSFRALGVVALGFVVCLAPWTIQNGLRIAEVNRQLAPQLAEPLPLFVPITAYGPLNLALANNPQADGTFSRERLPPSTKGPPGSLQLTDPAHLELFLHGDRAAWRFVREEPGRFAALVAKKWRLAFGATRLGFTQWDVPGGLTGVRHPVDLFVPTSPAGTWILVPWITLGAVFGWTAGGARRRWVVLTGALTACTLATTAFFFGYARLAVLLFPFWYALVALGVEGVVARFPAGIRTRFPLRRGTLAIVVLLFAVEAWGASRDRNFQATGTTLPGETHLNPNDDIYLRVLP